LDFCTMPPHFCSLSAISLACLSSLTFAQAPAPKKDFVKDTGVMYGAWRSSIMGGGGYIQNVVPSPTNPKRLYAYVDVGGLYRSDNAGETWKMLHGNLPTGKGNLEVRGMLVDPRDENRILAATGSQYGKKEGVYASTDGGETWKKTLDVKFLGNAGSRSAGFILARNPQNPDHVVAASVSDGVYRSQDNGSTWKEIGGKDLHPCDIRFDRTNPNRGPTPIASGCARRVGRLARPSFNQVFIAQTTGVLLGQSSVISRPPKS
jgi:hypothetical protein